MKRFSRILRRLWLRFWLGERKPELPDCFTSVRCICYACGWFRFIGFSGIEGDDRALIRFRRDSDCNLLKAEVMLGSRNCSVEQIASGREGYHDLHEEGHRLGVCKAEQQFDHLFEDRICPRCKQAGRLQLGLGSSHPYFHFDFDRHKCWRLTRRSSGRETAAPLSLDVGCKREMRWISRV